MKRDLVIGIDGGTGGMRAYAFDKTGRVTGKAECAYETAYPQNGWAEQAPADWWAALCQSVNSVVRQVGAHRVAALCAATTSCTVVCADAKGNALAPAILWMDIRAAQEMEDIRQATGQNLSAELFLCKALWLRRNRPELWKQTQVLCEYQDYLNHRLTGEWCFSVNVACNWGYNSRKGGFDTAFYHTIGIADALDKLPPRPVSAGGIVGPLCAEAAEALGLTRDVAVVQGGIDNSIGMLGMGAARRGIVALMTGSSNQAMAVTQTPLFSVGDEVNLGPDFLLDGYYTSFRGQAASGSVLKWFVREFCRDLGEDALQILDSQVAQVPPGSDGLLVLDTWQGARMYNDPAAKGAIAGLTMGATRAKVFRAMMEGIACGTREMLRAFEDKGESVRTVNISGGATRSDVFLQIYADVCGITFCVTSDHAVALGAAIAAAAAMGWYHALPDAVSGMARIGRRVEPNDENHAAYQKIYEKYQRLYSGLKQQQIF